MIVTVLARRPAVRAWLHHPRPPELDRVFQGLHILQPCPPPAGLGARHSMCLGWRLIGHNVVAGRKVRAIVAAASAGDSAIGWAHGHQNIQVPSPRRRT